MCFANVGENLEKGVAAKERNKEEMKAENSYVTTITSFIHRHLRRGLKYALVGTSGFLMDVGILYALTKYGHIWYITSVVLATLVTFVTNYFFNTYWTYRDAMKKLYAKNANAQN